MSTTIDAKVVVIGSQGSGKTSLVLRHQHKNSELPKSIPSTVGASFLTSHLRVSDLNVRLQVWDTAGQERFRAMAPMYYRHANAALVVYDITKEKSFADAKLWLHELKENSTNDVILCVIGNKLDLESERKIATRQGQEFADSYEARFYETSAMDSRGVEQVFQTVAGIIHDKYAEVAQQRSQKAAAVLGKSNETAYVLMEDESGQNGPARPGQSASGCCF